MEITAADYGEFYWCIKTGLSKDGQIFVYADDAKILPDGTLVLLRTRGANPEINLSISAGNWQAVYAAHVLDGVPFAVKRWAGEIDGAQAKKPSWVTKAQGKNQS